MSEDRITVIGAGLAGCAAALAAAQCGVRVLLCEQRPERVTPIHETALPSELAGSNDLGVEDRYRAPGLLKAELRELCPTVLEAAERARLGEHTLTVDRQVFGQNLLDAIEGAETIELAREEVRALPDGLVVVATGPATWSPLARALHRAAHSDFGFSYAGRAPLIACEEPDLDGGGWWPPYPRAEPALFLPVSDEEVEEFARMLAEGECEHVPEFTEAMVLGDEEVPVERLAGDPGELAGALLRGPHGPDVPKHGLMLRLDPDDDQRSVFHLHGCITALTEEAQGHALRAFSALKSATMVRPGVIHRLPWLPGPEALLPTLQLQHTPRVLIAGTLTGAYGYSEALATGAAAGLNAARLARDANTVEPPAGCLTGGLCRSLAERMPSDDGRMVQANYGMIPNPEGADDLSKRQRRARQVEIAIEAARAWTQT